MYSYDRRASYRHWDRKRRDRELGRLMDYYMDLDADGNVDRIPREILKILDKDSKLTTEEEDTLLAWSEKNTPGHYAG